MYRHTTLHMKGKTIAKLLLLRYNNDLKEPQLKQQNFIKERDILYQMKTSQTHHPPTQTWLIKEGPLPELTIKHDLLFKKLLELYFEPFLEAFYPQLYEKLDITHQKLLSEEFIADAQTGQKFIADLVIESKLKKTNEKIIIHIEPQSYHQSIFNERMYIYHGQLYAKYQQPIISIALLTHDAKPHTSTFNQNTLNLTRFTHSFSNLHLPSKHWRDYIQQENMVSATLMCLMEHDPKDKVDLTFKFMRILEKAKLDEHELEFLYGFFHTYVKLTKEEEEKLMIKIKKNGRVHELPKLTNMFEERGHRIGKEIGKDIGEKQEKERIARKMLKDNLPTETIKKYVNLTDEQINNLKKEL